MTFLSVLALSIGMSATAAPLPPASPSLQVEAELIHQVDAIAAETSRKALSEALADATQQGQAALADQIAASRPAPSPSLSQPALRARRNLDRMVAATTAEVSRQALSQALADATRQGQEALDRQIGRRPVAVLPTPPAPRRHAIASSGPIPADRHMVRAKRTLDRMVAEAQPRLLQEAVARALTTLAPTSRTAPASRKTLVARDARAPRAEPSAAALLVVSDRP
ncbi:MAG: hypothetical protein L0I62_02865 [Gammaproteobacteria bacterium]|nr:hypothetical protein [Gammaproteobacteria bacterium]